MHIRFLIIFIRTNKKRELAYAFNLNHNNDIIPLSSLKAGFNFFTA
jgi:hypothetical protein